MSRRTRRPYHFGGLSSNSRPKHIFGSGFGTAEKARKIGGPEADESTRQSMRRSLSGGPTVPILGDFLPGDTKPKIKPHEGSKIVKVDSGEKVKELIGAGSLFWFVNEGGPANPGGRFSLGAVALGTRDGGQHEGTKIDALLLGPGKLNGTKKTFNAGKIGLEPKTLPDGTKTWDPDNHVELRESGVEIYIPPAEWADQGASAVEAIVNNPDSTPEELAYAAMWRYGASIAEQQDSSVSRPQ